VARKVSPALKASNRDLSTCLRAGQRLANLRLVCGKIRLVDRFTVNNAKTLPGLDHGFYKTCLTVDGFLSLTELI